MAEESIKFYTLPHHHCSCTDEYDNLFNIGRKYKEFYNEVKSGKPAGEVLNNMKLMKMCCRTKFLSISYVPMIDRSYNRYYDDRRELITKDTRKLDFKDQLPEFPLLGK